MLVSSLLYSFLGFYLHLYPGACQVPVLGFLTFARLNHGMLTASWAQRLLTGVCRIEKDCWIFFTSFDLAFS